MHSIHYALKDLNKIIKAFKKEMPQNVIKSSLREIIGILTGLENCSDVEVGVIGTDFENYVTIDGKKAVLPDNTSILTMAGQYFLGQDEVQDEIQEGCVYMIGTEIEEIKPKN
ncbi:MAG: hypothetical protein H6850_00485 [Alphaproteobacteria bacterium]|nr:MAG: hypothetical protein H6850_00485 [Alphaproteobacteria bacterium]